MFIGHYSAAFVAAAHPKAPRLGTLFVAAQLVDIAFFSFVLLGIEHLRIVPGFTATNSMDLYDMPWTHSLLGALGWAAAFGLLILAATRNRIAALIAALVVLSHWLLDVLVHTKDMSFAGGEKFGMGLWNHPVIEMPLEIVLTLGSAWIYARATKPTGAPWALAALLIFLLAIQAFNWFAPPPVTLDASFSIMGLAGYAAAAALAAWAARQRAHVSA
jgi:hypothetical protein